jgi:hypothetical protein
MGSLSLLSRRLAHQIFITDRDHTVMYSINGTTSEDTNMGRWVQRARALNPMVANVAFLTNPEFVDYIANASTGVKM